MVNKNAWDKTMQSIDEIIDGMSLMDDDLFGLVFDGNISATQILVQTILNRTYLKIIRAEGQKELRNPEIEGRKIRLDILAQDNKGRYYNCEVQRKSDGAHPKRARYHSSMIDARMLYKGQKFTELNESYVIFITEKDYFKGGRAVYTVDRHLKEMDKAFEDGSHIIYVNGSYIGDDAIGALLKDFRCTNPEDIQNDTLAQSVKYYKEDEGGREIMCESVERYAQQYATIKAIQTMIETSVELGADKEKTIEILKRKFNLTEEEAQQAYDQYTSVMI